MRYRRPVPILWNKTLFFVRIYRYTPRFQALGRALGFAAPFQPQGLNRRFHFLHYPIALQGERPRSRVVHYRLGVVAVFD